MRRRGDRAPAACAGCIEHRRDHAAARRGRACKRHARRLPSLRAAGAGALVGPRIHSLRRGGAVKLVVQSPLEGWAMPLTEVPDEVFAAAMAGDGVAIDPTGDTVCAPFDGEVVPVGTARHAVTVRSASGVEILVHVGIDTVALGGAGFEW